MPPQVSADADVPRPRFLLRVHDFTIVEYSRPEIKKDVEKHGYGIISYTWGRFQDKERREMSSRSPRFHESIPKDMRWHFPELREGAFTMDMVRHVLENLQTRYAWWDWACIPQFWDSNSTPDPSDPRGPPIGFLKEQYKAIKDEEIGKQLFIYTLASKGFIWMHDTLWTAGDASRSASYLERLMLREQRMMPDDYLALLRRVKETEMWFSSMWTFQEGILLNTDRVVDPRSNKEVLRRDQSDCAILVDRHGNTLESDNFFRDGTATLIDITGRVTLHACDIASKLMDAYADPERAEDAVKLQRLLAQFNDSGFVSYMADAPLPILESSRARGGSFTVPADFCVNALLGALQVILPDNAPRGDLEGMKAALLASLVERYDWRMVLFAKPTRGRLDPNVIDRGVGDWVSILGMEWQFSALGPFIGTTLGSLVQSGSLGGDPIARPPVVHSRALGLDHPLDALIAGPDRPSEPPYRIMLFDLASSVFSNGWTTCRFYRSIPNPDFVPPRGKQYQCAVVAVPYGSAREQFGSTDTIALLPLEEVVLNRHRYDGDDDWAKHPILRCVVLSDFKSGEVHGSSAACGVFVGIGDFVFKNEEAAATPVKDVLGNADWRIYMY